MVTRKLIFQMGTRKYLALFLGRRHTRI